MSCYCSASHYSTDDYDSALQTTLDQNLNKDHISLCPVQNSDSGADLSEHFIDKQICKTSEIEQFTVHSSEANLEVAWEKFWSRNGENIIWKSWIEKFGAYINPNYFERNFFQEDFNLHLNEDIKEHDINTECSATNVLGNALSAIKVEIAAVKEDNFDGTIEAIPKVNLSSYSSCNNLLEVGESVNKNPYIDESDTEDKILKSSSFGSYTSYEKIKYISSDDDKLKNDYERVRSRCSNASLSVKSIANTTVTTDSMTNVTKITLSSLDLSCECESIKSSSFLSTSSDDSSG